MALKLSPGHAASDVVSLTNSKSNDCQSGIGCGAGGEETTIRDEEIRNIVRLSPAVSHAVFWVRTHPCNPHIVAGVRQLVTAAPLGHIATDQASSSLVL